MIRMAILKPDTTTTMNGVTVNEYLLTKHNPNRIAMPSASMEGKIIGVTVHNTDWISVASGTTPAEQYTRATVNGNMKDVRVHYYVDNTCAWQNLPHSLSGWHAADGSGNGNRRTIAIECIMSSAYNVTDKKSEDNCARLAAALLKKYNLDINHLFTHTHWLNVRDGKSGTVDYLNTAKNPYKTCPLYILPHWFAFKAKVQSYMKSGTSVSKNPTTKLLYRVRKSWSDAKSQIGAFSSLDNAKKACKPGYYVFDANGNVVYPTKKSVDEIAREVIQGKWGNGTDRKKRLTNAGYDYNAVQKRVNELMK
nr:MAG TPA: peptidoglycan hydrolase [Caudoviricetes sp.]